MWFTWLQFFIAAALVVWVGATITRYADELAEQTGIGRAFIGALLLGASTSLPEVVTSLSAVLLFDAVDMAIGNLLGSCTFNLLIIVVIDVFFRVKRQGRDGYTAGLLSLGLLALVTLGVGTATSLPSFYLHPLSAAILAAYLVSLWVLFRDEQRQVEPPPQNPPEAPPSPKPALTGLLLKTFVAAAALVGTSVWLSGICDRIAEQTGLGGSIVGAIFLAIATSLPELAVSISAARMGQMSLSLGNIYGSNIFNLSILGLVDLAEGPGGLFTHFTEQHLLVLGEVALMSVALLIAARLGSERRFGPMRADSWLLTCIYVAGLWLLF